MTPATGCRNMTRSNDGPLLDLLDCVLEDEEGEKTRFGDLVERIEERGYGPLIAFLSAFVVLPTGAIPGVPALIGVMLVLMGGQMLLGRPLWFPRKLKDIEIETSKVETALDKARPWAKRLEKLLSNRLHAVCQGPVARRLTALCILASGAIMVPLGFVPGAPFALGLSAMILGIGTTVRDGVWVCIGYVLFAVGGYLALQFTVI
ncbi:exopolysaccharide biosynthesis protein [Salipiger sp. IMCC34102]|uniref:exopolysaccharide biosynthesis protein n=1 Tax=Salipiger sp. IMCC34102 TaxID=2510647 RepID=UPI00101E11CF|nr:exopolysaccharide biosynthesis protein [Salipiger sp. IMCC34102]RYH03259.1 exopolysaccharide biosynthesis protein [Salipiger sp. IMCC34102]